MEIIGTIATVLAFVFAIYVYIKFKYPGNITCYVDKRTPLLQTIVDTFKDVSIFYKKEPIKNQLVIFRFFLVNTGKKDISSEMIKQPISLGFAREVTVLDAKVNTFNSSIGAKIDLKDSKEAIINFESLLINESIEIELLVEDHFFGNSTDRKNKSITSSDFRFSHRIIDTASIKTQPIPELNEITNFKKKIFSLIPFAILSIILILGMFIPSSKNGSNLESLKVIMEMNLNDSSKVWVEIKPYTEGEFLLVNDTIKFEKNISIDSLNENLAIGNFRIKPIEKKVTDAKILLYAAYGLISLFILISILEIIKNRRLRKIFIKYVK